MQQQLGGRVAGRKVERDDDIDILHEPETTAYHPHFDAQKGLDAQKGRLSVDDGVYFDEKNMDTVSYLGPTPLDKQLNNSCLVFYSAATQAIAASFPQVLPVLSSLSSPLFFA